MTNKNHPIKIVSLFSGIGGFEQGIKTSRIPFEVVLGSEIDKNARISYGANFATTNLYGDIKLIDEHQVPDHDCLVAGFPCQSFSIAGKMLGFEDTRGTLFFDVARILKAKTPKYFILENVKNLISHDNHKTIQVILKTLSDLGYSVDFSVINSQEAGVAQSRERTYIVGIYQGPTQAFEPDQRNSLVSQLKQQLNQIPIRSFNFFNHLTFHNRQQYIDDFLETNVDVKYYFNNPHLQAYLNQALKVQEIDNHYPKIMKLFELPREIYNDLDRQRRVYSIKGISPTILARSDATKIYLAHEHKIRKLTPSETFYLQGYDHQFVSHIKQCGMSDGQMYKQAGNAVSPPVITGIFKQLVNDYQGQTPTFKFIDLFAGIGGFRIAMERLHGQCVFSAEIDKYAIETYQTNFGESSECDLTKQDANEIPDHDVLCAGFPCQPFSLAGKRLGFEDTRGTLFFDVLRIIQAKRPQAFILENVAGIINHNHGETLKVIEHCLEDQDYVISWKVINAKDVGIPQNRNRWYCVGVRRDILGAETLDFHFPTKCELKYHLSDLLETEVDDQYQISLTAQQNINRFLASYLDSHPYPQTIIATEIRKSKCNFRSDDISPCLTAKMGTGGNNIPVLVSKQRKLTERECLRIMSFPESFQIKTHCYQSYKQIGNSVIVDIIQAIGQELIKYLKLPK